VDPLPVHVPELFGMLTVMLRAAIVVLDFFDAVPVAVTQSPGAIAPTDSVTVLENWVVVVQFTVVWPLLWLCTSMVEPLMAATLPVAPTGGVAGAAAPALDATAPPAMSAVAPVPRMRAQRLRRVGEPVHVFMLPCLFLVLAVRCAKVDSEKRVASFGA
jgi:hypothetical protein